MPLHVVIDFTACPGSLETVLLHTFCHFFLYICTFFGLETGFHNVN